MTKTAPRVTVVFLLYNAARTAARLVSALARQSRPDEPEQRRWLEAIFADDASRDDTRLVLERALDEHGRPEHWRVMLNPENLGLAATLNRAFSLARTPYVLSCHLDCFFGDEWYVSRMLDLIDGHPDAGAITGKPAVPPGELRFAERVNLVANLMDVLSPETDAELVPIGFAEGRCDIFRRAAVESAGLYDTTLRTAGEDQVLAARLRAAGFEVYQAPRLRYVLSVSDEQDTVGKICRHQRLFGRAHPYILLRTPRTSVGVAGRRAGPNRSSRLRLRAQQIASTALLLLAVGLPWTGAPAVASVLLLLVLAAVKLTLFRRHFAAVAMPLRQRLAFLALQPLLDASYTLGVAQGLLRLALPGRRGRVD
jgi:GT2 family glycosyltransferase